MLLPFKQLINAIVVRQMIQTKLSIWFVLIEAD